MARASHTREVDVVFSVHSNDFIQVVPRCVFVGLWQVVRHLLTRGKTLRVVLGNLNKVPHGIVTWGIMGIRWPRIPTRSARGDILSGLSSYSLQQIV
jgi:hypothetical protein